MNKIIPVILLLAIGVIAKAQHLKVETFGDESSKPIIFLHGGPGYNSVPFERTTAQALSENGFFVISYDRRGEGRNEFIQAKYTFKETFNDLKQIYKKFGLKKASLIGHSFGGVVATLFADQYPRKINTVVLVGAPMSMQKTLKNIVVSAKAIYTAKEDEVNLNYIRQLEDMDSTSLEYSSYCFAHAMSNGFYSTKTPNEKALELYEKFETDTILKKYAAKMGYQAPQQFWKNESYTTLSIKKNLQNLKTKEVDVYAIYGKEDGLYSKKQVEDLKALLGDDNVEYLENCSHNVFIDRQNAFITALKKWVN